MTIDSDDTQNDVWRICDELWRLNLIDPGGLKNYGGAGRILWVEDGKVVDYDWCEALTDFSDLENFDALEMRTRSNFP